MPETDYSKTIIYKIINYDVPDLVYVGSTTNLKTRKNQHKNASININNKVHHLKLYENIRNHGGWDCWKMIVICEYPCDNKRQAELEEDKYMMELKAYLNTNRASRTIKQYYIDNKDIIGEKQKQYYIDNKDKLKQYRDDHKDLIRQKNKIQDNKRKDDKLQYYIDNKDKLKTQYACDCGKVIQTCEKARHIKSKIHKKNLKTIE